MNTIIKNIEEITGLKIPTTAPQSVKLKNLKFYVNPSKYDIVGLVGRSNDVVMVPRYHTVRDSFGRFAKVSE